tara:strand:- start:38 stop:346 length:309 start_codon:yes stop_codon:yes gene_type:complete
MEKRKATIADALVSINPEIKFTYRAEDYNRLKILSDHSKPTKAEIDSEIVKLQAQFDSEHYKLQRQEEYPSWQDQMDLLYHGGIDALKAELKKTKDKYPKPT